jgi:hypothetical protein
MSACNRQCNRKYLLWNAHYKLNDEHTHCVTVCISQRSSRTQAHMHRHRQTQTRTDTDTDRQAHMHSHRQTGGHTCTDTDRHRQTQTHTKALHSPCHRLPPEAPSCPQTAQAQIPQLSQTASHSHGAIPCWIDCDEAP